MTEASRPKQTNQGLYAAGHAATLVDRPTAWFEATDFNSAMRKYGKLFNFDQQHPNPQGVPVFWYVFFT